MVTLYFVSERGFCCVYCML